MSNKIYVYKLNSGEEIIGESPENLNVDMEYEVFNPVQLVVMGKDNMGFVPYMPYCDLSKGLKLYNRRVTFRIPLVEEMANEYKRHFGKIITPPAPKLLIT